MTHLYFYVYQLVFLGLIHKNFHILFANAQLDKLKRIKKHEKITQSG